MKRDSGVKSRSVDIFENLIDKNRNLIDKT